MSDAIISHVTLGTHNVARAKTFYDAVLGTLGLVALQSYPEAVGYGPKGADRAEVWVMLPFDGKPATWGNGTHIAFMAPTRAAVQAFYKAAMDNGGLDEGAPGPRPHYTPTYYAAYVRDPDGNKLQAVCHKAE